MVTHRYEADVVGIAGTDRYEYVLSAAPPNLSYKIRPQLVPLHGGEHDILPTILENPHQISDSVPTGSACTCRWCPPRVLFG